MRPLVASTAPEAFRLNHCMNGGWLDRVRLHRRWIVHAVLVALLVPVLLGVLPVTGHSAESMLERDLALSLCSSDRQDGLPGEEQGPSHSETCVLCSACAATAGRSLVEIVSAFAEPSHSPLPAVYCQAVLLRPLESLRLLGSPPRGPPSTLLI